MTTALSCCIAWMRRICASPGSRKKIRQRWLTKISNSLSSRLIPHTTRLQRWRRDSRIVQADDAAIQRVAQRGVIQYTVSYSRYMKLSRPLADRVAAGLTNGKVFKAAVSVVTYPGSADVKSQVLHFARGSASSAWADLSGIDAVRMMLNETDLAAIAPLPGVMECKHQCLRYRSARLRRRNARRRYHHCR